MRFASHLKILGLLTALFAAPLSAQASRTWVSGVGDDANPGSRTAPCKTFAGAISKTAAGGEIDALDPGGFGALTITKAITLDGGGNLASLLVSGTNGINISAGANDTVILRNLSIQGIGTGLSGIVINSAKAVIIENCTISGFTTNGVLMRLNGATQPSGSLTMINSTIIGLPAASGNSGIYVMPSSGTPQSTVNLDGVRILNTTNYGIYAATGCKLNLDGSTIASGYMGLYVTSTADAQADNCNFSNNNIGIKGAGGQTRISNCLITGNATGISIGTGAVNSYGNNRIDGNGAGNAPGGVLTQR